MLLIYIALKCGFSSMHEIEIQSACKSGILLSLAMFPGEATIFNNTKS
jgi:hypothetical protein